MGQQLDKCDDFLDPNVTVIGAESNSNFYCKCNKWATNFSASIGNKSEGSGFIILATVTGLQNPKGNDSNSQASSIQRLVLLRPVSPTATYHTEPPINNCAVEVFKSHVKHR
jgi:hypothetical protein